MGMFNAVPLGIDSRILEPEVRGEVHEPIRQAPQLTELLHGLRMGEGDEKEVDFLEIVDAAEIEGCPFAKIGVNPTHRLPNISLGGHLVDLYVRMTQEESEKLAAAVTGRTHD
jgi:hypothetical protein